MNKQKEGSMAFTHSYRGMLTASKIIKTFRAPYLEAKGRFYELFILRVKNIAQLVDPDYVKAFLSFDTDKGNYEFTIDTGCHVKAYCWINLKWMSIEVMEAWTPF